ncbi:RXT2-like protein [Delphinella strobiligena]|nr:RXT2-like protein [Delphinella strobiligena]
MATQQSIMFAETIRAMKLAMRRQDNDSDSDSSIQQPTNRGNKLKRNASHVREGRLDTTGGRSYKRKIDHAGYQRYIIQPNPLRYDEDGDLIDDEDDHDAYLSPAEDNPWNETRLEELLAPLTSAADLSEHPSLSIPFTSKALTEMAQNARESLHRERQTLWSVKQLLLRFRGDDPWVPVAKLETDHDMLLLDPNALTLTAAAHSIANETDPSLNESAISTSHATNAHTVAAIEPHIPDSAPTSTHLAMEESADNLEKNGHQHHNMANGNNEQPLSDKSPDPASPADSNSNQPQHRMTTRARARTPTSPALDGSPDLSPAPSSVPPIHGFFHLPELALPDRDYGLPTSEAEETRRLLILFVQKQDQVVREAEQMLDRLLKANRMRKNVYQWSKAEAHVGELSDGEDWYDKDDYNLETDLVKGKEEEEIEEEGRGKGRRRRGAQH